MAFSLDDLAGSERNNEHNARIGRPNGNPSRTPFIDQKKDLPKVELSVSTAKGGVNSKDSSSVREVSSYDIAPPAEQKPLNQEAINRIMGPLDRAVEREKERISELQSQLIQDGIKEMEEEEAEKALAGDDQYIEEAQNYEEEVQMETYQDDRSKVIHVAEDVEEHSVYEEPVYQSAIKEEHNTSVTDEENAHEVEEITENKDEVEEDSNKDKTVISKSFDDEIDDALAEASDDEDENEDNGQEDLEEIKDAIKQKITPIKNKLNLAQFKISKTARSVNDILKSFSADVKTANWVLPNANTCEVFTPLSAVDIINLDPANHNKSRLNTFRSIYKTIYDHIATPGKPDYEKWLRTTLFHDMDHLYFGLYLATFGDSAFINPICEKASEENKNAKGCGHQFIEDHKPMDYVKFASDEAKQKFEKIRNKETVKSDTYEVTLVQVSDEYAFGLKMPSIYNVILETASISQEFLQKYSQLIEVFSYIDEIYYIDCVEKQLVPVKFDIDKKNQARTTLNKIKTYNEIYKNLTADQQALLLKNIRSIETSHDIGLTYCIPASTCPECGNEIPEKSTSPQYLLFMRHQLGRLASI